jgi:hypothetical protein
MATNDNPKKQKNPLRGQAEKLMEDLRIRHELGDDRQSVDVLVKVDEQVYRLTLERVEKKAGPAGAMRKVS